MLGFTHVNIISKSSNAVGPGLVVGRVRKVVMLVELVRVGMVC